jgi:hypothetical protein
MQGLQVKGLQLAEDYYRIYGAPMIAEHFAPYAERIAIGFAGAGSECFGFDDEVSQDHDWGPAFCIWLTEDDFTIIGADLQRAYEALPPTFLGYGPRVASPGEGYRTGVTKTTTFYRTYTGLDHPPATQEEWRSIPEQALAVCTNGKVFSDPLGAFTAFRQKLLAFYPDEVRLKKLASYCMTASQAGQYNYPRSHKRGDTFVARYAEVKFCADIIFLVFLLNRRYAPFYKWMYRAVKELPLLGETIYRMIADLTREAEFSRKVAFIEEICARIIGELRAEGLSDKTSSFLFDHAKDLHL